MQQWSVYLIRCSRGALYAGIATEVERRLEEHRRGRGAKALRGRGPLALVYRRAVGDRSLALRVEHGLKRLAKAEKEALVRASPSRSRLLGRLGLTGSRG
ncbi:MAG: GIY-YIG nuclease family protein [Planctomycetota bacterium]